MFIFFNVISFLDNTLYLYAYPLIKKIKHYSVNINQTTDLMIYSYVF